MKTLISLLVGGALLAQEPATFSSIEVKARPELVPFGGKVTLSGHTGLEGPGREVKITVKAADGTSADVTAKATENGDFSVVFDTTTDGRHEVEAVSPGGRDRAKTSFYVPGSEEVETKVPERQTELIEMCSKALEAAEKILAEAPISPAREEMKAKLAPLKEKLRALRQADGVKQAMESFERLRAAGVSPIAYQPVFAKLTEFERESSQARQRIERGLAGATRSNARCDSLHQMFEALQAMGVALSLIEKPFNILVNFAKDYDSKKLPGLPKNPAQAAVAGTIIKSMPDLIAGPIGLAKIATGMASDAAQYASQSYFEQYCVKFDGPIEATTAAEYLKDGVAWRKSSQRLAGRLTLRYPKDGAASGEAIRLSGEFVGYGIDFTHWDDAIPILFKKVANQVLIFRKTVLPALEAVADDFSAAQGQIAAAAGPSGFRIPVEGELTGNKVRLRLLPASTDMGDLKARVICFVGGPQLLSPVRNNYEFSFQKAHQILSAAMGSRRPEDIIELDIAVDRAKKIMTIEREFKGTRGSRTGLAYADYTLNVKITNPPQ